MSVVKDINGKEAEAFDLIMRKEFAWEILEGKKKIEFRSLTPFYIKRFYNTSHENGKEWYSYKDIYYIHFHDYGNTWFLNIKIKGCKAMAAMPEYLPLLHKYGHFEWDSISDECVKNNVNEDDIPSFFGLFIESVLSTSLASLSDVEKSGKVKVVPVIEP